MSILINTSPSATGSSLLEALSSESVIQQQKDASILLEKINIRYYAAYNVFNCMICKMCYQSSFISRHVFSSPHYLDDSYLTRADIKLAITMLADNKSTSPSCLPDEEDLPLEYLEIQTGTVCQAHQLTFHGNRAQAQMQEHILNFHHETSLSLLQQVQFQKFFSCRTKEWNPFFIVPEHSVNSSQAGERFAKSIDENESVDQEEIQNPNHRDLFHLTSLVEQQQILMAPPRLNVAHDVNDNLPWLNITQAKYHLPTGDLRPYANLARLLQPDEHDYIELVKHLRTSYDTALAMLDSISTTRIVQLIKTQTAIGRDTLLNPDPFIRLAPGSIQSYKTIFVRFILYLLRLFDQDLMQLYNVNLDIKITNALAVLKAGNKEASCQAVEDIMISIVKQDVLYGMFTSPLACFLIASMIDPKLNIIRDALACTPDWARMKYAMRLFFIKDFHNRHMQEQTTNNIELASQRDQMIDSALIFEHSQWLTTGAMCRGIFRWISSCTSRGIALKNNGSKVLHLEFVNGTDKTGLLIDGMPIYISDWSEMILQQIRRLEVFVVEKLTFGDFTLPWNVSDIYDDTISKHEGYSFINAPKNQTGKYKMSSACTSLLEFWQNSGKYQRQINNLYHYNGKTMQFYDSGMHQYAQNRRSFLKDLAALLHLTSGMPGRGSEMLSIRIRNVSTSQRNIYILQGKLTIITNVWKGMNMTHLQRVIPRVPAPQVADLLLLYIIVLEPLERLMASTAKNDKYFVDSAYLFPMTKRPDEFLSTTVLESSIRLMTKEHLGIPLTVQKNRHLQKTWSRYFLCKNIVESIRKVSPELIDDDQEQEESAETVTNDRNAIDLQMGHSMKTANYYGKCSTNSLSLDVLTTYQAVSCAVHKLFCLDNSNILTTKEQLPTEAQLSSLAALPPPVASQFVAVSSTQIAQDPTMLPIEVYKLDTWSSPHLTQEAYQVVSNIPNTPQKHILTDIAMPITGSPQKRQAYATIMDTPTRQVETLAQKVKSVVGGTGQLDSAQQGYYIKHIQRASLTSTTLIVSPTGSGKTLLMLFPYDEKATIIVVPLQALLQQHKTYCEKQRLSYLHWTRDTPSSAWARLIFVSIESAVCKSFINYASSLANSGCLGRIMVDECHLVLRGSLVFRDCMLKVAQLRVINVATIYLTATLPIADLQRFKELYLLDNSLVILRSSSNRTNIHIQVKIAKNLIEIESSLRHLLTPYLSGINSEERILIFFNNTNAVNRIAKENGFHKYYSQLHDKNQQLQNWLGSSPDSYVMISTCALECGIDYKHVRLVVHLGHVDDVSCLAQELGRAGRDMKASDFIVLTTRLSSAQAIQDICTISEEKICYRAYFSKQLDNETEITCTRQERACGLCAARFKIAASFLESPIDGKQLMQKPRIYPSKFSVSNSYMVKTPERTIYNDPTSTGSRISSDGSIFCNSNSVRSASDHGSLQTTMQPPPPKLQYSELYRQQESGRIRQLQSPSTFMTGSTLLQWQNRVVSISEQEIYRFISSLCGLCSVCKVFDTDAKNFRHGFTHAQYCSRYKIRDLIELRTEMHLPNGTCFYCKMPQLRAICAELPCSQEYKDIIQPILLVIWQERASDIHVVSAIMSLNANVSEWNEYLKWCCISVRWPDLIQGERVYHGWLLMLEVMNAKGLITQMQ